MAIKKKWGKPKECQPVLASKTSQSFKTDAKGEGLGKSLPAANAKQIISRRFNKYQNFSNAKITPTKRHFTGFYHFKTMTIITAWAGPFGGIN